MSRLGEANSVARVPVAQAYRVAGPRSDVESRVELLAALRQAGVPRVVVREAEAVADREQAAEASVPAPEVSGYPATRGPPLLYTRDVDVQPELPGPSLFILDSMWLSFFRVRGFR